VGHASSTSVDASPRVVRRFLEFAKLPEIRAADGANARPIKGLPLVLVRFPKISTFCARTFPKFFASPVSGEEA